MKKINKSVFILIGVLLWSLPLGVLVRLSPFENINIYPLDVLTGLVFIVLIGFYFKRIIAKYKKLFYSIIIFNLVAITSLFLSLARLETQEFLAAASYLLRFDAYISLLFIGVVGFSRFQVNILKKTFTITTFLVVVLGFIQYLFYSNLKNLYYLGWDEHLNRLFSTFLDPNFTGLILVLFSIFILGNYVINKGVGKKELGYIFISFASVIAILLTYSRTALVSLILGLGVLLVGFKKIRLLLLSGVVLLIGVLLISNYNIEGENPFRTASVEARLQTMSESLVIFQENPLIGVGFNTYRYAQIDKGFVEENPEFISNAGAGTDNSLLFILATTGVVGFTAYLSIWYFIIKSVNKNKKRELRITSYSIIAALFLGSQFINALFYAPIMMWVFFYLGMFVLDKDNYSER